MSMRNWLIAFRIMQKGVWIDKNEWICAPSAEDAITIWAVKYCVHPHSGVAPLVRPYLVSVTL